MAQQTKTHYFDVLIIGSGVAGMINALHLSRALNIAIISKDSILSGSSLYAQGGISAVLDDKDSFRAHISDTLNTAQGLADIKSVDFMVKNAPAAICALEDQGVIFSRENDTYHLTIEGGHSARRVVHIADKTGSVIQTQLFNKLKQRKNISIFEHHITLDLLVENNQCYGAFIFNKKENYVSNFFANHTVLATGGASKVYLYTSNPDTSTGDGIAMAYRAGCHIVNMEFTQFHPTCLYHREANSFLISEALRGEGAKLILANGESFMSKYDKRAELAPRDIVARAIDSEMKESGIDCVYLDISFKKARWIKMRFPAIYAKCLSLGIDITKNPIPVVPSAHYTCGGIHTDLCAKSDCANLYAIGETAHARVHGANRMASNSLLECVVFARACAQNINEQITHKKTQKLNFAMWDDSRVSISKEQIIISHLWHEVRRLMWHFVGIVRSDTRLKYAKEHLIVIEKEIDHYYRRYLISSDLIELRNLVKVAIIIVESSLKRRESRGLYYNIDYKKTNSKAEHTVIKYDLK